MSDKETAPRIYAASRASVPERPRMWQSLRKSGVNIVSSWIDEAMPGETTDLSELWVRIAAEIASADCLVLYVEPTDFPLKGAFIEVGIALALGKPVRVVTPGMEFDAPGYQPIGSWINHPSVKLFKDVKQACRIAAECTAPQTVDVEAIRELLEFVKENNQCTPGANCAECELVQPLVRRIEASLAAASPQVTPSPAGVKSEDFWIDELEYQIGYKVNRNYLRTWLRAFAANLKSVELTSGQAEGAQKKKIKP